MKGWIRHVHEEHHHWIDWHYKDYLNEAATTLASIIARIFEYFEIYSVGNSL